MEEMNKKPSLFSRIGHFFRSYKSETKKIVWPTWKQVLKNTLVVLVIVLICAAIIGALDYAFSGGIKALTNIIPDAGTTTGTTV